jgi:hypothetical protein
LELCYSGFDTYIFYTTLSYCKENGDAVRNVKMLLEIYIHINILKEQLNGKAKTEMHLDGCNAILILPDKTCSWQAKIFRIFVICCTSSTKNI